METVRADHQVEATVVRAFEGHAHAIGLVVQCDDRIAEQDLGGALDLAEDQPREIAPREGHEASAGQLVEDPRPEPGDATSAIVNDAQLAHVIADAIDLGEQPHPLRDVVAEPPEVNGVAAGAQRGALDERRREAMALQPVGERRAGDPDARDEDGACRHPGRIPDRSTRWGKRIEESPDGAGSCRGRIPRSTWRKRLRPPIRAFSSGSSPTAAGGTSGPAGGLSTDRRGSGGRPRSR